MKDCEHYQHNQCDCLSYCTHQREHRKKLLIEMMKADEELYDDTTEQLKARVEVDQVIIEQLRADNAKLEKRLEVCNQYCERNNLPRW